MQMNPTIATNSAPFRVVPSELAHIRVFKIPELVKYFTENLGASLQDAANAFKVSISTINRVISSDAYQRYARQVSEDAGEAYTDPAVLIKAKATAAGSLALDLIMERLDSSISNDDLCKMANTLATLSGSKGDKNSVNILVDQAGATANALLTARNFTQPLTLVQG